MAIINADLRLKRRGLCIFMMSQNHMDFAFDQKKEKY